MVNVCSLLSFAFPFNSGAASTESQALEFHRDRHGIHQTVIKMARLELK